MRILIAEDEVTIARALKVMLEKNKYAVDMVHNGNDALDYIQATTYDALVLDIMMPGKDGIEVLKAAAGRETHTCPVSDGKGGGSRPGSRTGCRCGRLHAQTLCLPVSFLPVSAPLPGAAASYASSMLSFGNVTLDCSQYLVKTALGEARLNNKEYQLMELFFCHPRAGVFVGTPDGEGMGP